MAGQGNKNLKRNVRPAEPILVGIGGGGDDDEIGDLLYKGG